MRHLLSLYKPYMIRPTLYRSVTKGAIALAGILVWDRFVNAGGRLSPVRDGSLVAAAVLFAAAWITYLRLDGVAPKLLLDRRPGRRRRFRLGGDIMDYMDEHIVSFYELEGDEQLACGMVSSLLPGALFLVVALAALLF